MDNPCTDHSREYVPLIVYGKSVKPGNYGTFETFGCIAETILNYFELTLEDENIKTIPLMY